MQTPPTSSCATIRVVSDATGYGLRFLGKHGWRMVLWFFCLLLPLWGFKSLVGEVHKNAVFSFDVPMLNFLHSMATPTLDRFFVLMSRLGYLWGVIPLDALVLLFLVVRRRFRDGLFFGLAVAGSAILNIVAKNHYARLRPDLWISLTPESTFSFPSGHAMGSTTLGLAAILLCWPTRGRWATTAASLLFVLLVALSRIYLGVHYPSDILAGWTAAIAWTVGMYILVDQKAPPPPQSSAPARDSVGAGMATASAAARGGPDHYRYDPRDLSLAKIESESNLDSAPDQTVRLANSAQVVYVSAPFEEELGQEGTITALSSETQRARYRESFRSRKLVSTKEPLRYDFNRFTFASRLLRKGSRLVCFLSAAKSFQYEKNYNSGGVVADETIEDSRPVTVRIFHDAKRRSALYVPIAAPERPGAGR